VLGYKGLAYFLFSAAHDADAEFARLYAGSQHRKDQLLALHGDNPAAAAACARLAAMAPIL
jgi:hypothetical protein